MVDGLLSVLLMLWVVWLGLTTPYVVRRASSAMGRTEFEMMFGKIMQVAVWLFVPCVLIFGLLSWRFLALMLPNFGAGHGVLWFVVVFVGLMLLLLHCLVNAVYYIAVIHLGVGRD